MENMSKITHRQYFIIILQLFIIYYIAKYYNYWFYCACLENLHLSNPELSTIKTTTSITLLCSKSVCKRRSIRWSLKNMLHSYTITILSLDVKMCYILSEYQCIKTKNILECTIVLCNKICTCIY